MPIKKILRSTFQGLLSTAFEFSDCNDPISIQHCIFISILSPMSGSVVRATDSDSILLECISTRACNITLQSLDDCNVIYLTNIKDVSLKGTSTIESKNPKVISNIRINKSPTVVEDFNASFNVGDRGPLFFQLDDGLAVSNVLIDQCEARFMIDFLQGDASIKNSMITNSLRIASDRSLILADQCALIIRDCILIAKSSNERCLLTLAGNISVYDSLLVGFTTGDIVILSLEAPEGFKKLLVGCKYTALPGDHTIVKALIITITQILE